VSGTGAHCDHTVHISADLSLHLWLDNPMFWWSPVPQKCNIVKFGCQKVEESEFSLMGQIEKKYHRDVLSAILYRIFRHYPVL